MMVKFDVECNGLSIKKESQSIYFSWYTFPQSIVLK